MACARYGMSRLVAGERSAFLGAGGDPAWLDGISSAPIKLRRLVTVNKILAHRPWCLSQLHIKELTVGEGSWSLAELVQAIVILVHFHSACSFELGDNGQTSRRSKQSQTQTDKVKEETKPENAKKEDICTALDHMYSVQPVPMKLNPVVQYTEDPDYKYIDLSTLPNSSNLQLRVHDFSWDDHGFSVMSRFYADMSILLDDKFRVSTHMTNNSYGNKKSVDTSRFRRAIWNHVQSLYGVVYEDYDYSEVQELLDTNLENLVRTSTVDPASLNHTSLQNTMLDLKLAEKIHVKILIIEAKMQALLLYALRAIMEHMA